MLNQGALDQLWDDDDPKGSEARLLAAITSGEYDADERAELATQLGRAVGLQGRYEEADALLDAIDGSEEPTIGIRVLVERGRILAESGHAAMAAPLLEQAAELGDHLGEEYLAVEALHLLAVADPAHAETWTRSALEYASTAHDPAARRWVAMLHQDLGELLEGKGRGAEALVEFQLARQRAGG
ncbi:hypothetical protein V1638_15720 [Pseudarthrobacter sp. J64]|uniref:hypothetical protein n=1 Tax=Pseudarthrobacter sp. J64 TaxID=3116485 RepID=UPI002E81AB56|nr:hypothetical protein [Pseudarthrobacter sp. J64]MEE2570830.1 hypothetical protein [Pseudarthrobacter sp. J64]